MPKIVYIEHNGTEHVVDAEIGKSLMQNAVDNLIPGIIGDCGGSCTCATCHGYIGEPWNEKLPAPSIDENMMLEGALQVLPTSRLTCQIRMSAELDGITVRMPESQI